MNNYQMALFSPFVYLLTGLMYNNISYIDIIGAPLSYVTALLLMNGIDWAIDWARDKIHGSNG